MPAPKRQSYDAVIVGAGISGALIAHQLGRADKQVLIIEAGAPIPTDINGYMKRFFNAWAKVPEIPYTPELFTRSGGTRLTDPKTQNAPRPTVLTLGPSNWQDPTQSYFIQKGPLPFGSTYERVGGGTVLHWLGTSLRFAPNDFRMKLTYNRLVDWPNEIDYNALSRWYSDAEKEIGVSADIAEQKLFDGMTFERPYPMPGIPPSRVDDAVRAAVANLTVDGVKLVVTGTPAGRNSQPYQARRVCAGNTNCIPICPIQAKYDPSVTLNEAFETGNVEILYRTVATEVVIDGNGRVTHIEYKQYETENGPHTNGRISAKVFVIAAHAIETPKLLLMSTNGGRTPNGVANSSGQVGRNLMDHPIYLAWALAPQQVFGYRGPLSTSGIESLRDGKFRSERAAFRIEIGNEGWNFPIGDPFTTTLDFINGGNDSKLNPATEAIYGQNLVMRLNNVLSRQFRLGFLVEQSPEDSNRVTLSEERDNLNLPRPQITYNLSDYTKKGMAAAKQTADKIFASMNATQFTNEPSDDPSSFDWPIDGKLTRLRYYGAGHIVGTYRMGGDKNNSVVNHEQRSWDHQNLFLVGSGTFPTVATANPTLTLAALTLRTADVIKNDLT
jgi:choline dehydrogenase-like flavoprotein